MEPFTAHIAHGGWFAAWSNHTAQASIFFNRGLPIDLQIRVYPQTSLSTPVLKGASYTVTAAKVSDVTAGQELVFELAQLGTSLRTDVKSLADVQALVEYLANPTGLIIIRGKRLSGPERLGLLEVLPDATSFVAEVAVGTHPDANMLLPLRIGGFNRRWTVGMWQETGWVTSDPVYTNGSGYTELGLDAFNQSYVPIYSGRVPRTHVSPYTT